MSTTEKTFDVTKPRTTYGDTLRFTPYAYAKLIWMRNRGDTEVAGYATTETDDPLLVTDFRLIKQKCTSITFELDPNDMIEDVERMMDMGLSPWQTHNILCHTHPGDCPNPSGVDEDNFIKAFSHPNWAIMFIIAEGGDTYCRLKINVGPGVAKQIKVAVDWSIPFVGSRAQEWEEEYKAKVREEKMRMTGRENIKAKVGYDGSDRYRYFSEDDPFLLQHREWAEFDRNSGSKTEEVDDTILMDLDCHWDNDGRVVYWSSGNNMWYAYDPIEEEWYEEDLEDGKPPTKIPTPEGSFADEVVAWGHRYADERIPAMED